MCVNLAEKNTTKQKKTNKNSDDVTTIRRVWYSSKKDYSIMSYTQIFRIFNSFYIFSIFYIEISFIRYGFQKRFTFLF